MSDLRRALARVLVGSLLAVGVGAGLAVAGLPDAFALGAAVAVGLVAGRVLFGRSVPGR